MATKGTNSPSSAVNDWIREQFKKRECVRVVPISKDSSKCCCGRHLAHHYYFEGEEDSAETDESGNLFQKWTVERCTASYPTDSHGTITFRAGKGSRKARYVRADFDSDPSDLWRLFVDVWGFEPPTLVISIHDSQGDQSSLSPSFIKAFKKGLSKAARTASTWIITSGLKTGITEHVTAAFNDTSSSRTNKSKSVHIIGFAPWGLVRGADQLLAGVNGADVPYSGHVHHHHGGDRTSNHGRSPLAEGHSGFVLIDEGTLGRPSPFVHTLRRSVEHFVRNFPMRNPGGRCIPMVCLMVNGDISAMDAFLDYISNEPYAPVVACAGTRGLADLITSLYEKPGGDGLPRELPIHRRLNRQIQTTFGVEKNQAASLANALRYSVKSRRNFITVYRVFEPATPDCGHDGRPEDQELDVAMLNALLKGLPLSKMEKLNLTVTWDREDLAREILEDTGGVGLDWPDAALDEAMMNALMYDRVDFVNLLLSNGIAMDRFLTIARLEQLYNSDCGPPNTLRFILRDVVKNVNENSKYKLSHIGLIIEKLMGFGYRSTYCRREFRRRYKLEIQTPRRKSTAPPENQRRSNVAIIEDGNFRESPRRQSIFVPFRNRPHFAYPYHELFIWAVLTNRKHLAMCFWKNGQEQLAKALIGSRLYESLAKEAEEDYLEMEVCQQLEANARVFNSLACELLAQCYETDDDITLQLLTYELRQFSKCTCICLAANCHNESFVAHQSCQLLLADLWLGGLRLRKNINLKILAGILFPPIIAFLTFKTKEELQLQAQTAEESQNYRTGVADRKTSWQDDSSVSSSESDLDSDGDEKGMSIVEEEISQSASMSHSNHLGVNVAETPFSTPPMAQTVRFSPSVEQKLREADDRHRKYSEHSIMDEVLSLPSLPSSSARRKESHQRSSMTHLDGIQDDVPARKLPKPFRRFATSSDLYAPRFGPQHLLDRPPVAPIRPKQRQQLEISRKILEFYLAPITTFWSFTIGYMIFLSFFTYIVLVKTPIVPEWPEYYVIAFFATFSADMIRKILVQEPRRLSAKLKVFFSCIWDFCAVVACIFFFLALFLRLDPETLAAGRVLYCTNIVYWYLRVMRLLSVNSSLSPFINMYGKMVVQLFLLSTILFIMLASFGVLRQSIMYPDEDWHWALLRDICYKPYSMLYGSLYPDDITACDDRGTNCTTGYWLTPIFMTIYLLLAIVVFMNMMVAAFSHIFNQVNARAQEIAKFEGYHQVMEFEQQPFLFPPLVIFSHIYLIGKYLYRRCYKKDKNYRFEHSLKLFLTVEEKEKLHEFERDCLTELLAKKAEKEANSLEARLVHFTERLDAMTSQVDYLYEQDQSHRIALLKFENLFNTWTYRSDGSLNNVPSSIGGPPTPRRSVSEFDSSSRKSDPLVGTIMPHFANGHITHLQNKRPSSPSCSPKDFPKGTPTRQRARMLSERMNSSEDGMRSRSGSAPTTPSWKRPASVKELIPRKRGLADRNSVGES